MGHVTASCAHVRTGGVQVELKNGKAEVATTVPTPLYPVLHVQPVMGTLEPVVYGGQATGVHVLTKKGEVVEATTAPV